MTTRSHRSRPLPWYSVIAAVVLASAIIAPERTARAHAAPSTQIFKVTIRGTFTAAASVLFTGSGDATVLGTVSSELGIGSYNGSQAGTNCQTGQGKGYFTPASGGDVSFVTIESSCHGMAPGGLDLDTGYFIITGGTGAYAGVAGTGTFVGGSTLRPNEGYRTYTGVLVFPAGSRGAVAPLVPPAGGFHTSLSGDGKRKFGTDHFSGKGSASGLGTISFKLERQTSGLNRAWTGCLSYRGDGSITAGHKGTISLIVIIGTLCGGGAHLLDAGYYLMNGGTGRYLRASGRGTITGTETVRKTSHLAITFRGSFTKGAP